MTSYFLINKIHETEREREREREREGERERERERGESGKRVYLQSEHQNMMSGKSWAAFFSQYRK